MSRDARVARWTRPSRLRVWREDIALGGPLALVPAAVAGRVGGAVAAVGVLLVGLAIVLGVARWRARRFDRSWLIAALDAARGDLEDSSDLLFADPATLGPLQALQRRRIVDRAEAGPIPVLSPPRDRRLLAAVAGVAVLAGAAILLWPRAQGVALAPAQEGLAAAPGVPRLTAQALEIMPPAYTGLPPRVSRVLDARVPQGSRLRWTLRFDPAPRRAMLATVGRAGIALGREGEDWHAGYAATQPLLYRVTAAGAERAGVPPLHRIDLAPDRPPQVRLVAPVAPLTLLTPGQRSAAVAFVATDDYGVRATATLRVIVAQGEGENVRFSERLLTLSGSGPPRARHFAARLDFASLGFTEPGDVVAQLIVADMREPAAQSVRGPSAILRRPPAAAAQGGGLEAMTRRVMPAYFRSQRQIVIDAEALLAERPRPAADRFLSRSDAIGADQRLLRMRYGQFMGEEAGGGATSAMPTNDEEEGTTPAAPTAPTTDAHDHPPAPPPTFGAAEDVTAEYGHTHDESEAATLLDPSTRATLRQALDAMFQSERELRQGDPARALPFAYKALRFIKQVQQATRIFLARTGSDLPAVDMQRRLTGARGAMGSRTLVAAAADPVDPTPAAIWRALDTPRHGAALDALSRWLTVHAARVPDPLALAAAIDTLRRRPGCAACRETVRGALWQALPRPVAGLRRRDGGDAIGRRYLDALP
ncbi:DUF4175 domain-containing protein [Sphingomonas sp. A2-49]|uniref:DUF4175 domain-containing protein n=1 Tax=Sphingomonas sp. A2-49 TaxID=1391375 RepID=UPI0021D39892|nr:DUF4175 domain-containing protein [Sphingomonas sp. A2-49]MCU6452465.1 DUF4175 domain-containing protein [Sphingomonas sp. A2-49]